jgi:hypothetical protein
MCLPSVHDNSHNIYSNIIIYLINKYLSQCNHKCLLETLNSQHNYLIRSMHLKNIQFNKHVA